MSVASPKPWCILPVLLVLVVVCTYRRSAFERNPHLRLLKDDLYANLEHPVVAPGGTTVYYINAGSWLCKLDISADTAATLRFGWLQGFAVSPDGARLALLGHALLLADTTGAVLDTLVPVESIESDPIDVEFSHDGFHIYYSVRGYAHGALYYRVAIDGSSPVLVHESFGSAETPVGRWGFDLSAEDSIVDYFGSRGWPQLSPLDDDVMAYSSGPWMSSSGDIHLLNLATGVFTDLDCNPYPQCRTDYPNWFPDGRKLVFSATDSSDLGFFELWTLDSIEF